MAPQKGPASYFWLTIVILGKMELTGSEIISTFLNLTSFMCPVFSLPPDVIAVLIRC
uniref:Uncharacterized protein n=1 Tax=Arundo donax TaxID=35708 RepID=A0A0A9GX56_ARUDO